MAYQKKEPWSVIPRGFENKYLNQLGITNSRRKLIANRPSTCPMGGGRDCKQQVYEKAACEARRWHIGGHYVGLAAAYIDEIFALYKPCIKGEAIVVERNKNFAGDLLLHTKRVSNAFRYRKYKTNFKLINDDILNVLSKEEYRERISIIDLDLMCCLNDYLLKDRIYTAVKNSATDRVQLLVWSAIGHGVSWKQYEEKEIKELIHKIESTFTIREHNRDYYCDVGKRIPMKCERFILERRK